MVEQNDQQLSINVYEQIFQGKQITILGTYDNPIFLSTEIAEIFGIKKIRTVLAEYDIDEAFQGLDENILTPQIQALNNFNIRQYFLTEKGLYRYIYQSRSQLAKQFRDFVFQLLKSLRLGKLQLIQRNVNELQNKLQIMDDQLLQKEEIIIDKSFKQLLHESDDDETEYVAFYFKDDYNFSLVGYTKKSREKTLEQRGIDADIVPTIKKQVLSHEAFCRQFTKIFHKKMDFVQKYGGDQRSKDFSIEYQYRRYFRKHNFDLLIDKFMKFTKDKNINKLSELYLKTQQFLENCMEEIDQEDENNEQLI